MGVGGAASRDADSDPTGAGAARWALGTVIAILIVFVQVWVILGAWGADPAYCLLQLAVSIGFVSAGLLLALDADQRPNGFLLIITGIAWVIPSLAWRPFGPLPLISWLLGPLSLIPLAAVLLRYPGTGRLQRHHRQWLLLSSLWLFAGRLVVAVLGTPPGQRGWWPDLPSGGSARTFADHVSNAGAAIVALTFGVLIVQRLLSRHTVTRYSLMPVAVSALAAAIGIGTEVIGFLVWGDGSVGAAGIIEAASLLAVPVSFVVAGFRTHLTYLRTTMRMLDLPVGSSLREGIKAVASALEEPGLELCVYDPAAQAWVNDRLPLVTPDERYLVDGLSPTGGRIALSYVRSIDYEEIPPGLLRLALTLAARAIFSVPQGAQENVRSESGGFLRHSDRQRLERNLHDGVQRHLISMLAALQSAPDTRSKDRMAAFTKSLREDVKAALHDVRALSSGETGAVLQGRDLASALREAAMASPFDVDLRILPPVRLPPHTEENVFLLICEVLTNAAKHAKCESVRIELMCADFVLIEVCDDGVGGLPADGARTLRERAEAHRGNLTVLPSTPEWRTRFVVTLPVG